MSPNSCVRISRGGVKKCKACRHPIIEISLHEVEPRNLHLTCFQGDSATGQGNTGWEKVSTASPISAPGEWI